MSAFKDMIARCAQPGRIEHILIRSRRYEAPTYAERVTMTDHGLEGDHGRPGKRAVTLIQAEHLPVIGAMLGTSPVDAALLRRNLVVSGLNLNALKGRQLRVGGAILEITGICAPCSRMEKALGPGGYSAMRGHGGWCAQIVQPGQIAVTDKVVPLAEVD